MEDQSKNRQSLFTGYRLHGLELPNRVVRLYGQAALDGWKKVVDEVHEAGGRIAPQLWHVG